jgi:selenocysteine lyase/cysteine desulfurase
MATSLVVGAPSIGMLTAAGAAVSSLAVVRSCCVTNKTSSDSSSSSSSSSSSLPAPRGDFFLPPSLTYLNCATLGPTPRSVIKQVTAEWEALAADPLNGYFGSGNAGLPSSCTRNEAVRTATAEFLGADVREIVVVPSTTVAYNTLAEGMVAAGYLTPNDVVLSCDHEHPGGESAWLHLEATAQVASYQRVILPCGGRDPTAAQIISAFEASWSPAVRVVAVSHVLTTTGLVLL